MFLYTENVFKSFLVAKYKDMNALMLKDYYKIFLVDKKLKMLYNQWNILGI